MFKRHYFSAIRGLRHAIEQWTSLPERAPVLVYSMRKVGSTTVTKTLRKNNIHAYKLHFLNSETIAEYRRAFARAGGIDNYSIIEGVRFRRRLDRWRKRSQGSDQPGRLKIFTFVKDPISIAASDYFMQLFYFLPAVIRERGLDSPEVLSEFFKEVMWSAVGRGARDPVVAYIGMICALPCVWFDKELKSLTGVDVYDAPFSVKEGVAFYEGCDSDVVLIRTDKLSMVGLGAINRLIGVDLAELITSNVRSQAAEGRLYQDFRRIVRLPEELARTIYDRARIEKFYSPSEVEAMLGRWIEGE